MLCQLCDDREVAFWCNDCRQWICAQCKKAHDKLPTTKQHPVTPLAVKVEQFKRDVRQEARPSQERANVITIYLNQLEQALKKQDGKLAKFLQQSYDLKMDYVQKINDHFNYLNSQAMNFIDKEVGPLRNSKKEAEKSLEAVSSRLQTLLECC